MRHPLSLEAFTDWLATMPADGTYTYTAPTECLNAQYLRHVGFVNFFSVGPNTWSERIVPPAKWWERLFGFSPIGHLVSHPLPDALNSVAIGRPRTFGAALSRARELQRTAE